MSGRQDDRAGQIRRPLRMIKLGNLYIEVFRYTAPPGAPVRPRMCYHGITHPCLYGDDASADCERLTALGIFDCPLGGSAATRATYGHDCDGNVIELLQIVGTQSRFGFEHSTVAAV